MSFTRLTHARNILICCLIDFSLFKSASHIHPIAQWHTFTLAYHLAAVFLNMMLSFSLAHSCCCFVCPSLFTIWSLQIQQVLQHHQLFKLQGHQPPRSTVSGQHGGFFLLLLRAEAPQSENLPEESKHQRLSTKIQTTFVMNIFFTSFTCLSWLNLHHSMMICLIYTYLWNITEYIITENNKWDNFTHLTESHYYMKKNFRLYLNACLMRMDFIFFIMCVTARDG